MSLDFSMNSLLEEWNVFFWFGQQIKKGQSIKGKTLRRKSVTFNYLTCSKPQICMGRREKGKMAEVHKDQHTMLFLRIPTTAHTSSLC